MRCISEDTLWDELQRQDWIHVSWCHQTQPGRPPRRSDWDQDVLCQTWVKHRGEGVIVRDPEVLELRRDSPALPCSHEFWDIELHSWGKKIWFKRPVASWKVQENEKASEKAWDFLEPSSKMVNILKTPQSLLFYWLFSAVSGINWLFYRCLLVRIFLAHWQIAPVWFWFGFSEQLQLGFPLFMCKCLFRTCWEQVKHNKWALDRILKEIYSVVIHSPLSGSKSQMQALLLRKFFPYADHHPYWVMVARH